MKSINLIAKILLYPFGFIFGCIAAIRRKLFDLGIFKRHKVDGLRTIVVGNLAIGGTGKTPMVIHLAGQLRHKTNVAVLSRGYKRKSKGFLELRNGMISTEAGDEPLEIFEALNIPVFVCEDRVQGLKKIKATHPEIETVILDDAFQHLRLKADIYLLLTDYHSLFTRDYPMPCGRLREFRMAATNADAIVVTKIPKNSEISEIENELKKYSRPVFYATFTNLGAKLMVNDNPLPKRSDVFVFSGLANNSLFLESVGKEQIVKGSTFFADHHEYTEQKIQSLNAEAIASGAEYFLSSQKDAMRLKSLIDRLVLPLAISKIEVNEVKDAANTNILLFLKFNA